MITFVQDDVSRRTKREKGKRLHEIEMKIAALEGQQKELTAALKILRRLIAISPRCLTILPV